MKNKPRKVHYRNHKNSDSLRLNTDLKNAFAHEKLESCIKFDEVFMKVLNRHAPLKKKVLRPNHSSCISKKLRKAIMTNLILRKSILKKEQINLLEPTKSRKIIAVDFVRKKEKCFRMG